MLDYLQFQWSSWVVAYDVLHRERLLGTFGNWMSGGPGEHAGARWFWMAREVVAGPETLSLLGKVLYWLGLLGVLGLSGYLVAEASGYVLGRWRRHRQTRTARLAGVRFYEKVVSTLAGQHLVRRDWETPREFASRVEQALPQMEGCFLQLIDHYYAIRYGRTDDAEGGEKAAREILRRIRGTRRTTASRTVSLRCERGD